MLKVGLRVARHISGLLDSNSHGVALNRTLAQIAVTSATSAAVTLCC